MPFKNFKKIKVDISEDRDTITCSVEIMQRHPEIVSALISHLTQDQILDHEKDKWFLDD